ncbi:SurA N-terminal domain-containing protein [Candidatus Avelusimicrobium faecicola]|uniref:peptidylprolyl isomerase n=1 Tax=Candidatus Avelusimicrobium faecicola TaxID=3416205 RepID=UPI0015A26661|nr:SurA N-terminal domain-containing protein [Spirochaetota bacterium]MCI7536097.1 SurA N-terminal domain-containing protein [Spirochaetota bacterium]MDE3276917.1 SurA N-terminal domain-containing protein [Spirochaetota bacterium]MDY2939555.1 SurA N-terminal domain-containing protein [Elusimicrobiaceae bacterium]MDY6128672.1 SurA N-terminal domain-containing protein [Elusimicrobiaceae bacterium]
MKKMNKLALLALALTVGVGVQAKVMESSVATVNGRPVLSSEYDSYLSGVVEQYKVAAPQILQQPYAQDVLGREVLKELISKELLYQAADEAKIQVKDSDIDAGINEIKARFMVDEKTGKEDPKGADKRFSEALKKQHMSLKTYKEKIKKDIAVRKLVEQRITTTVKPVEEADVKALYSDVETCLKGNTKKMKALEQKDPARFKEAMAIAAKLKQLTAEQVRIGHIYLAVTKDMKPEEVKAKEETAKKIKKELDGGKEFSTAVKEYTEDKAALASGGDMILIKGIAPKALDQQAFSLPVGEVSAPIKTDVGFHIIKIKEKRAEKQIGYDDIKRDLAQYLAQQKIQTTLAAYIGELYDKADVKITKTFESDKLLEEAAKADEAAKKETSKESKK